jgi:hypothetical protein
MGELFRACMVEFANMGIPSWSSSWRTELIYGEELMKYQPPGPRNRTWGFIVFVVSGISILGPCALQTLDSNAGSGKVATSRCRGEVDKGPRGEHRDQGKAQKCPPVNPGVNDVPLVDRPSKKQLACLDEVLWWLPADTETITVSHGPMFVDPWNGGDPGERGVQTSSRNAFEGMLPGEIAGPGTHRLFDQRKVSLLVQGFRKFEMIAPAGEDGPVDFWFEGCQVLIFEEDLGEGADSLVQRLRGRAKKLDVVEGHIVARFDVQQTSGRQEILIARPESNVLLIAFHSGYLAEVLSRMQSRAKQRAFSDELPEWKYLDRTAPEWAIRHFDRMPKNDPTSPFNQENGPDDTLAVGVVYVRRPNQAATIYYLSENADAVEKIRSTWGGGLPGKIEIRQPKQGVVESQFRIVTRNDQLVFEVNMLYWIMGIFIQI